MRRAFFSCAFLLVGLFLTGFPVQESAAASKITIKAVSCWPVNHVGLNYYKEFIKRVNEKSKGELEIKLLGGPEVVSAFDQLKAATGGVVDMIHGDPAYWAGAVPEGGFLANLNLAKEKELKAFRESGIIELYREAYLQKAKARFLGSVWIGMPFYIMTNKPVSKLEGVKGLKLRGMGGLGDVLLGELGASVVRVASAEVYEALQRGIVDGVLRNTISLVEFKEYEVVKYILLPSLTCPYGGAVFIGEGKWNTIPKHLQTMMQEVMIETERESLNFYAKMDKDRLQEVQEKHGMKVINLSESDIAKIGEIRAGAAMKDWIYKKSPKFGPPIYEKMLPYLK